MGRQPNGSSTIYQGADGKWHTYVMAGRKADGSLDRRHVKRDTAGAVAAAAEELRERLARGTGVAAKIETVEHWLTYWLENVVQPGLAYSTAAGYASLIRNRFIPDLGQWKLEGSRNRLEPQYVEAMYARMRRDGLSSSYVLQAHRVLSKALKDAMRRGRAARNVCDMIDPPRARSRKVDAHSLEEVQAILVEAMKDRDSARWLIGLLLGPRQGEALGLRWNRVHLDSGRPYMEVSSQLQRRTWRHGCDDQAACAKSTQHLVPCEKSACRTKPCPKAGCRTKPCAPEYRHACPGDGCGKRLAYACPDRKVVRRCARHIRPCPALCPVGCTGHASACPKRKGGGLVEVDVKSQKGERDIPLPPIVVEQLRELRERQIVRAGEWGTSWDPKGLVFVNEQGRPMDPRRDHAAWERLLQRAGVEDSRLHAARHTAATFMLGSGTDTRVVQEILGHSRISVTEVYMDVAADLKRQAVDRIASALMDGQLTTLLQGPAAPVQRSSG